MTASHDSIASRKRRGHRGFVVARDAEVDGLEARSARRSASSIGRLESRILPGVSGPDSTSSSPVDSTPTRGAGNTGTSCDVDAREHTEVRGAEHGAGTEHELARLRRRRPAGARARPAAPPAAPSTPSPPSRDGELDDDDGVGAVGHRGAGHDPDRLAGADRDRRRVARGQVAHHPEADGRVVVAPAVSAARTA